MRTIDHKEQLQDRRRTEERMKKIKEKSAKIEDSGRIEERSVEALRISFGYHLTSCREREQRWNRIHLLMTR